MGAVRCPDTSAKFYLEEVVDKRGNADPRNVGFTQTGLFNRLTTLLTSPMPSEILGSVLADFLDRCLIRSDDRTEADLTIDTSLITLQVTEVTTTFSEVISVELRSEFTVRAAATGRLTRRFIIDAAAEDSGLDTTQFASAVIEKAIVGATEDLAGRLESCGAEVVR